MPLQNQNQTTAKERALARAKANALAEQRAAEQRQVGAKMSLPAAASGGEKRTGLAADSSWSQERKTAAQKANREAVKSLANVAKKDAQSRFGGLKNDAEAQRQIALANKMGTGGSWEDTRASRAIKSGLSGTAAGLTNAVGTVMGSLESDKNYGLAVDSGKTPKKATGEEWNNRLGRKLRPAVESVQGLADKMQARSEREYEEGTKGLNTAQRMLFDAGVAGTQMLGDMAIGALTGGNTLVPMAARVFGQGAQEARRAGATRDQQLLYGALSAGVETFTEKMFDGLNLVYGKGAADRIVESVAKKLASGETGQSVVKALIGSAGEGLEEVVSGLLSPALGAIYNGKSAGENYSELEAAELLYEGAVGAMLGGVGGAANVAETARNMRGQRRAEEPKSLKTAEGQQDTQEEPKHLKRAEEQTAQKPAQEEPRYLKTAEEMAAEPTLEELMAGGRATQEQQEAFIRKYGEEAFNRLVIENMQNGRIDGEGNDLVWKAEEPRHLQTAEEPARQTAQELQTEEPRYLQTAEGQTAQEMQEPRYLKTAEDMALEEPGVHGDTAWMSRGDADYLSRLAKAARASIEVVDTLGDAQGTYDPKTGRIRIAKDATDPVGFVTQHELTHRIRDNAPQQWGQFLEHVQKHYGEDWNSVLEGYQRRYAEHDIELTAEEAAEEAAADFAGRMNESDIRRLTQENRSLAQRILDTIRDLIRKLKGGENQKLYEMERLWASALKEGKKNTATEGGKETQAAKGSSKNAEKTKKSLKSYTEEEKKQHVKDAAAYFGRTYKWAETGYITTDGKRLDFSGRHEGGSGGYRTVDHRDIRDALGDDYGGDDYSGGMVQFMSEGNIRVSPESGGIDLSVEPTKAQEAALSDFISKQRGEVILDLGTPDGQTVSGTEYPRGTHASKVLADIRAYFEDGTTPQVSEVARYRQSLKGSKEAAEETERLREQNKRLEKEIAALKDAVRMETRSSTDRKSTEKAAREMRKRFDSAADQTELTEALLDLYDGMAAGTLSNQEMRDLARRVADTVIDGTKRNVNPLYEEYADLRKALRTEKVTLPEENRADIQDGYNTLRKRAMGSVKIGNDGIPVDTRYEALSEQYPELFPDDILNPADQLERMVDVGGRLKKTMESPYKGLEGEDIRQGLANDILEQFFDISTTQSAKLQRMQREWEKQRTKDRKATDERFRKSRERQERRIRELKQDYAEANRRRQENATATVLRDSIGREALRLGKKLTRPTDKNHVPEEFRGAVAELVRLIDTESGYDIETTRDGKFIRVKKGEGDPTKKTNAARALKAEIEELQRTEGLTVDPELQDRLNEIADMKDIPLAEMNRSQLETVWKVVRSVSKMITESNRMFGESRYATVSAAAEKLLRDNGGRRDKAQRRGALGTAQQLAGLEMMTPETYFHELGQAGEETFRQFRRAADEQTRIVKEATDLAAQAVKDSGLDVKKLEKETKTFHLESGEEVTLTKAQLMELYELTKRKQAQEHIFLGGVKSAGYEVKTRAGHRVETPSKASKVTLNDVSEMLKTLTPAEKKLADILQKYMSGGLARHGNRASYDVYGYNKFTEKDYWPIKVNKGEVQSDVGAEAKSKTIPSFGMTRAVTPKASNGLMLNSFLDTYTEHVNQMATYAAWLGASENANRLYNYRFRDGEGNATGDTVKNLLQKVYGRGGTQYFEKLMSDIAQGTKTGADQAPTDKLLSSYKAAAVGANLRVIMQQPTAILRAAEMINPKYLAKNFGRKGGWDRAVKHAPIAQWKDWGYFELDTGRSLRQLILGSESGAEKVREASMAPAGWGDSIAWGLLWNAVEDETADRRPDLRRGSQEFYDAAADRFTDIIYRTQVVDNVLNRSQAMRKNGAWRLATSFMSEPSKVYNMMQRDVMDLRRAMDSENEAAKRKAAKHIVRTSTALVASFAVNAVAQAVADSMRDDDREETPLEKFGGKWMENFAGNFNPLGYVPFAKDVMSIIQGYDVERMDMSAFSDAWAALQTAYKAWTGTGSKSALAGTMDAAAQMCKVAGLPVYNVKRDLQALIGSSLLQTGQWQALYELDKLLLNPEKSRGRFYDTLYYAMLNDWDAYEKIYADMLKHGFDEDGVSSGMESRMKAAEEVKSVKQLPVRWAPPGTEDGRALKNYIARNRED